MEVFLRKWSILFIILGLITGCAVSPVEESDGFIVNDEETGETEQEVTQADKDLWKNIAQWSRDTIILARAGVDINKNVGENCKNWARTVVSSASKGVVSLPATCPNASGWYWCSSPYVQQVGSIYSATPGNLVQMNFSTGPHTAIVWSNDGSNICWIDSNYYSSTKPNTVTTHCQSISQFLNSVTIGGTQKYTVYRITGG